MVLDRVKRGKRSTEGPASKTVYRTLEECQYPNYAIMNSSMENLSISKESTYSKKSSAESSRIWREKKKHEPEFLENERSRKKKERQNMTPEMKATVKEKARLRQQKYRQRQKLFDFLLEFIKDEAVKPDENVPKKRRREEEDDKNSDPLKKLQKESRECSSNARYGVPGPLPCGHFCKELWLHPHSEKHSSWKLPGISTDSNDSCLSTETTDGNIQTIVPSLYKNEFPELKISNVKNGMSYIGDGNGTPTRKVPKVQSPSITSSGLEAWTDYSADDFESKRSAMLLLDSDICVDTDISNSFSESGQSYQSNGIADLDPSPEQTEQFQFDLSNSEASTSNVIENIIVEDSDDLNVYSTRTNMNSLPTFINDFDDLGLLSIFDSREMRVEQQEADQNIHKKTDELVDNKRTTGSNYKHGFKPYKKNAFDIRDSLSHSGIRQKYRKDYFLAQSRQRTTDASRQPTNNTSTQLKSCTEHAEKELANVRNEAEVVRQAVKRRTAHLKLIIDKLSKRCLTICDEIEKENYTTFEKYKSYFYDHEQYTFNSNDSFLSNNNAVVPGRKKLRFRTDHNVSVNNLNNIFGMVEVVPTEAPNNDSFNEFLETLPFPCVSG